MKRLTGIAALVAALACGDSRPLVPCSSDAECKAGRKCADGYCESSGGEVVGDDTSSGDDTTTEKPCGNSPLVGKYLWLTDCYIGMTQNDSGCTGAFKNKDLPEDQFTYEGVILHFSEISEMRRYAPFAVWELIQNFSREEMLESQVPGSPNYVECGDFSSEKNYREYMCALNSESKLYTFKWKEGSVPDGVCVVDNLFVLMDEPWQSQEDCYAHPQIQSITQNLESVCGTDEF